MINIQKAIAILIFLPMLVEVANAESIPHKYHLMAPFTYDLYSVALNGTTLDKAAHDLYLQQIDPAISNKTVGSITSELWSIFWTYMSTLWPHEMGHWMRAPQVGGRFNFKNYSLPVPHTTMDMPDDSSYLDHALVSVAGFEVNSIMARINQFEFYESQSTQSYYAVHGLLQKTFFPIYSAMFPSDPDDPQTWTNTRGDPAFFAVNSYQHIFEKEPLNSEGNVDSDMVGYYKNAISTSILWPLLDPYSLQTLWAMFFSTKDAIIKPWYLLGDKGSGWTYGTMFNPSPLGYELYLFNFFSIEKHLLVLTLKYGIPALNNQMGVKLKNFRAMEHMSMDLGLNIWRQKSFGYGYATDIDIELKISDHWSLISNCLWKSKGYLLGEQVEKGFVARVGIGYDISK